MAAGYGFVGPGGGGGLVLWEAVGLKRLGDEPLAVRSGFANGVSFSADGKTVAAGCGSVGVALWDLE